MRFSFRDSWNHSIEQANSKPTEPRDYIYASELGGSVFDIYHKMKGEEPTTPPNLRSYRKFNAGHTWEWIIKMILYRVGAL